MDRTAWNPRLLLGLLLGAAAVGGLIWIGLGGGTGERDDSEMLGRRWTEAPPFWGTAIVSADAAVATSRESAARRPEGESGLVIPHAEVHVTSPRPLHGPGSRASNPLLVFTTDSEARTFLEKASVGSLSTTPGEYRIAIDRAAPVRLVTLDGAGRMRRIQTVRPVFITAVVIPGR